MDSDTAINDALIPPQKMCKNTIWDGCRCSTVVAIMISGGGIGLGRNIEHLTVCRLEGLVEDQDQHNGEEVDH